MSVVVLLTLKAKPEAFEGLKSGLAQTLTETIAFKGCLGVHACADPETHSLVLYERWEDKSAQEAYIAWRTERGDMDGMGAALREPPLFETRDEVFSGP